MRDSYRVEFDWEREVLAVMGSMASGDELSRPVVTHAQDVLICFRTFMSSELCNLHAVDRECLVAAGLLHDCSLIGVEEYSGPTLACHASKSKEQARRVLQGIRRFSNNRSLLDSTLDLIERHEDTSLRFPAAGEGGCPYRKLSWDNAPEDGAALRMLREADSISHLKPHWLHHAVERWLAAGIPRVCRLDPRTATWRWMDSVSGNLRLAGKRAMVDSRSAQGVARAAKALGSVEDEVRRQCALSNALYEPEIIDLEFDPSIHEGLPPLEIERFITWDAVHQMLRRVRLHGDRSIRVYRDSTIDTQVLPISSLTPFAKYMLVSTCISPRTSS